MAKGKKRYRFNSVDFITYVWEKRRYLLLIVLLAAILSAIASFLITPKFESQVVLYPATSASISKTAFAQEDNLKFGNEQETEQLIQVLNSEEIKGRIIHKFDLAKHYKIKTSSDFWKTQLTNIYRGNISIKQTEYSSIIIDAIDVDPDTSALIANEISNQVDSVFTHVQRERAQKTLAIVEKEYVRLQQEINKIEDSLKFIQEHGVTDYESQSRAYSKAYAEALANGKFEGAKRVELKLKTMAQYSATNAMLTELLKAETLRLSNLKARYLEAKVDAEQTIPHKFVIDKAYPSDKKAYPKRLLIVLVSTISAFFMALLLLIIRDSITYKNHD
ncbi:MAG: Wzz/FepE/Etk N-terminal domain-containing protein [Bacteroidota bacterium]|nr:Wzz/FepE/Etk N-terminal domain-containing protein [Bacteroidota bacterium]